jgi:hypothetical protein
MNVPEHHVSVTKLDILKYNFNQKRARQLKQLQLRLGSKNEKLKVL